MENEETKKRRNRARTIRGLQLQWLTPSELRHGGQRREWRVKRFWKQHYPKLDRIKAVLRELDKLGASHEEIAAAVDVPVELIREYYLG